MKPEPDKIIDARDLIPQMYNAHRFDVPLQDYPVLCEVEQACLALDAFKRASPEQQIDAIQ